MSSYNTDLDKNAANYVPLTPLTFIKRVKDIYPDYEAIIYEDRKYSWSEVYKRTVKFASALSRLVSEKEIQYHFWHLTPQKSLRVIILYQ